jgi:hypothetical protein
MPIFDVGTEVVVVLIDRLSQILTNIASTEVGILCLESHDLVSDQLFLV